MFNAQHIIGKQNDVADSLSRKQFHRFRQLVPGADEQPEVIAEEFVILMSEIK